MPKNFGIPCINFDIILKEFFTPPEVREFLKDTTTSVGPEHECYGFTTIQDYPKFYTTFNCPQCRKHWITSSYFDMISKKAVTPANYIAHYIGWCTKNNYVPLAWDILQEIFYGCESNEDYYYTLNTLYSIQIEGFQLSFMKEKDSIIALNLKLRIRLELFERIPSATNMLLAYNLIEEITLKTFSTGNIDISEEVNKRIERFDKLKALALGTKHIPERKLAFERSVEVFHKLIGNKL